MFLVTTEWTLALAFHSFLTLYYFILLKLKYLNENLLRSNAQAEWTLNTFSLSLTSSRYRYGGSDHWLQADRNQPWQCGHTDSSQLWRSHHSCLVGMLQSVVLLLYRWEIRAITWSGLNVQTVKSNAVYLVQVLEVMYFLLLANKWHQFTKITAFTFSTKSW